MEEQSRSVGLLTTRSTRDTRDYRSSLGLATTDRMVLWKNKANFRGGLGGEWNLKKQSQFAGVDGSRSFGYCSRRIAVQEKNHKTVTSKEKSKMNRREFLTTTSVASMAGMSSLASGADAGAGGQEYFEFRQYHLPTGSKKNQVGNFLREVGIPAMNRIGIGPVGVFQAKYGPSDPTLYVMLVHKSLDSVVDSASRLMADEKFRDCDFVNASLSDPGYVRVRSSLMVAFKDMPKLAVPKQKTEDKSRIFELRTYESHSIKASKKKIEMFNEGGEIRVFKKTGLAPVFFGETIVGPQMPNLTYMLVFDDLTHRDAMWKVFGADPEWKKLRSDPQYRDTVSNITDIILTPTRYSQI